MPALLVHGNPDSSALWNEVVAALGAPRTVIEAVDLPGFAAPVTTAFGATKEEYVAWLVDRLERLHAAHGPVDLVGHDWGSLLVQRIASIRPDLLASVACGGAAVDRAYPWHGLAQVWQTPEAGERYMEEELTPEFGITHLLENGVPREHAERNAWLTPGGKDVILRLYRSAIDVGAEWQPDLETLTVPALVLWGREDPYVPLEWGERLAARMHADLVVLECGHWWPYERPAETAAALAHHWAGADQRVVGTDKPLS